MKKIAFIIHGKIRRRQALSDEIRIVFSPYYKIDFFITTHRGHATELAATAVMEGANYMISVGGDGTLNEVANGLMRALPQMEQRKKICLGLLPFGTGNDFSRTIRVTRSLESLKAYIDNDRCHEIDLGQATFTGLKGMREQRFFVNITDVGIGGFIVRFLDNSSKIFGAFLTYQYAIFYAFFHYRKQPLRIRADDWSYEGKAMELVIANGQFIGGGLCIAPGAKPDDGKFLLALGGKISLWDYLKNWSNIQHGKKIDHPEAYYQSAQKVLVEAMAEQIPIDMDGDFVGYTPLQISMVPQAIRFLY